MNDTHPEADRVQTELFKKATPAQRIQMTLNMSEWSLQLAKKAIQRAHPDWPPAKLQSLLLEVLYGGAWVSAWRTKDGKSMTDYSASEIQKAIEPFVRALDSLGVHYYIGGSVASSAHGAARATRDVDFVSCLMKDHVSRLVDLLKDDYSCDDRMILDAIWRKSSFNLVHFETSFKLDVFIHKGREYDDMVFLRTKAEAVSPDEDFKVFIASPEDVILSKLEWCRLGGGVSEKQLSDIAGVFKVQADHIDREYLKKWAKELKVEDLLSKVLPT